MSDLVEFLRARLAEDEAIARAAVIAAHEGPNAYQPHPELAEWVYRKDGEVEYVGGQYEVPLWGGRMGTSGPIYVTCDTEGLSPAVEETVGPHIARHDPARALREVEGKRIVLALHTYEWMGPDDAAGKGCEHDYEAWPCPTLRALAAVYADHPDYREEWSCVEYG